MILSSFVRNQAVAGLLGQQKMYHTPTTAVMEPKMMKKSLHEAMADVE